MEPRYALVFLCLVVPLCVSDVSLSSRFILEPYDFLFDTAVEAYYRGDWLSVILNMEKALRNKATIRRVKALCRLSCANQTAFGEPLVGLGVPIPGAGAVDDLGFFQIILKRADCVNSCEKEKLGPPTMHKVSGEMELEFKKRSPYNYLQVAYFKINKLDKAVAAANTFFLANPDHMEMKQNLDYYRMMAGVQEEDFKDLEARPHMAEFLEGKRYYSDDLFGAAAEHFEAAVEMYFIANRECRALCEGDYDYDGYNYIEYSADLFQSMTDHYMQVLNCKQHCAVELALTAGKDKPFEDFLPSHFNYLQFSYYNSDKFEQAIECAKTFLFFHPNDEVMKQNLAYYSVMLGEDKAETISARQVVKQYIKHSILEKELLYFGYEAFGITFVDPDSWTPEEVMPKKLREKQKADRETAARITEEIGNLMKEIETLVEEKKKDSSELAGFMLPQQDGAVLYDDIKVTMTSEQMNGSQRVLLDGVISDDECRELHRLSNAAALKGDGYSGRPSPHSPSEMFQGVTVLKAVKLGQEGKVPLKSARLFFDLSEKVRKVLESHFRLETPLYFSYSHLVCRSAIDEKQEDRNDLSHPVHVDNCLLVSELNECIKEPPAYTHRDYSAILYLNDDFEGGDFIFTELDAKTVTAAVRPQCGRVVGFGAGRENPHGVRAVTKGQRCAVALWFTLDPAHQEKERIQAEEMLKMFSTPVNEEFTGSKTEVPDTLEAPKTMPKLPTPPDQESAEQKAADKPPEPKLEGAADTQAEKPAETQVEKPAETQAEKPQAEKPAETQAEKPADTQAEKPADTQAEKPADTQAEKPAETQAEKPAETQAEKPAETLAEKPADTQAEKPAETQAEKPADTQAEKPADTQAEKPADTQAEKPADTQAEKPAETQAEKPAETQAEKPAETQAEKPAETQAEKQAETQAEKPAETQAEKPAETQAEKPAETQAEKQAETQAEKAAETQAEKPAELQAEKPAETQAEKPAETQAEKPAETQAEKPAETQAEKPADTQAEKPAELQAEKPAETQAEKPAEIQAEKPAETQAEKPAETQAEKPQAEKPAETQAEKPAETLKDKAEAKTVSKTTQTKAKPAPKIKAKAGQEAKAKTAGKVKPKPAAKTDGKQPDKTQSKQAEKKDTKPAAKKTAVKKKVKKARKEEL